MENRLTYFLHAAAAFQYLNAAIKFNVFESIEVDNTIDFEKLRINSQLTDDSLKCLLFGLTTMRLIYCENGIYKNSPDVKYFFSNNLFDLIKSMNDFQSEIVYLGLHEFVPSLKNSKNEGLKYIKGKGETLYQRFSQNKKIKTIFYTYMEKYSEYAISLLLKNISFNSDKYILDIGGGMGINAISIANNFPNVTITIADLNFIEVEANDKIQKYNIQNRVVFSKINIFKDNLPHGQDSVLLIHQLVIWSIDENIELLKKAYTSLNIGGRVIIYSSIADDNYCGPVMAALDSVYFKSVATGKGLIYSWADYHYMLDCAGFVNIQRIDCKSWTPHGIIIGTKK